MLDRDEVPVGNDPQVRCVQEERDGFAVVKLQSESMEISVVPELGAKILELTNRRSGRQWLWQPDEGKLFTNQPGDPFERSTMSGADECLPTVAACGVANRNLPDHGEIWSCPWQLNSNALHKNRIETRIELQLSPLVFERSLSLTDDHIQIEYQLTNLSHEPEKFLWAFHPLMRIELGDELLLPISEVSVEVATLPSAKHGDRWPWSDDLSRMDLGPDPGYAKLFATDLTEGRAEIHNRKTGDRLVMRFDPNQLPALGIWITRGGWNGYHHVAIEPTHVPFDSLAEAVAHADCPILKPGGVAKWAIQMELHCDD